MSDMLPHIQGAVSQMRHLYQILALGQFTDHKRLADGLLKPQIERLEWVMNHLYDDDTPRL